MEGRLTSLCNPFPGVELLLCFYLPCTFKREKKGRRSVMDQRKGKGNSEGLRVEQEGVKGGTNAGAICGLNL